MHETKRSFRGQPQDWPRRPLSDLVQRVTTRNDSGENNVLTISATQGLVSQEEYFNRRVASDNLSNYFLLRQGDFAYNKSYSRGYPFGVIRRLKRYPSGVVSPLYICFRPDPASVNPDFLDHYLDGGVLDVGLGDIAKEGVRNHGLINVGVSDFFGLQVGVPPLPEQRRIAEVLDTLDETIQKTEQVIAKLRRMKQGLLHNLLTRGIDENGELRDPERHPEQFVQSEIGSFPVAWAVRRLAQVARYQNGAPFPSSDYREDGIALLRPGNLRTDDLVVWDVDHTTYLPREWERLAPAFLVGEGEVVMNLTAQSLDDGFLGRVCITPKGTRCLLNQRIARFSATDVETGFLFWALRSRPVREQLDRLPQGTKVQHLYNRNLDVLLVPSPRSRDEQRAIDRALVAARDRVSSEEAQLSKLQLLKQGLSEDLLTGRVRVTKLLEGVAA